MKKERKWKKILDIDDFFIEGDGDSVRIVDNTGTVINSIKKKTNLIENYANHN